MRVIYIYQVIFRIEGVGWSFCHGVDLIRRNEDDGRADHK